MSIPDDTRMRPGEGFVKTWRLVNAGSCVWSRDYAIVYFSGVDMGYRREDFFRAEVKPGEALDISLDMVAPLDPGSYQGNYKLRGKSGELFGIGPEGGSPFWARIEVVAAATPTDTVSPPTLTPTAAVFSSGSVHQEVDQAVDLDIAAISDGEGADLILRQDRGVLELVPQSGARVLVYGILEPGFEECKASETSADPVILDAGWVGAYLCVRTDRGLPGRIHLVAIDMDLPAIDLSFVIWAVP